MLKSFLNSKDINIEYFSLLSLLKIDIKDRGIDCCNKKLKIIENEYSKIIKERINFYSPLFKFFIATLLSSEMVFNRMLCNYHEFFKELYFDYFENIIFENINLLGLDFTNEEMNIIKDFKAGNNLSNIFLLVAEKYGENKKSKILYQAIANNLLKLSFTHLPFVEHLAYAKYKIGNIDEAIGIYKELVERNPDVLEYRIELLNYYFQKKDLFVLNKEIKYIEATFNLNDEQVKRLSEIKESLI